MAETTLEAALVEVARLQTLIVEYCTAFMDLEQARRDREADADQFDEKERRHAYAFNGLANEMIDVESGNAFPTLP